jgi:hypothetical protein
VPVVTLSLFICHVKNPTFADDYHEAILGGYAAYDKSLELYTIGLWYLAVPELEPIWQCNWP